MSSKRKAKIVIRGIKEFRIDAGKRIYEVNMNSGTIEVAFLRWITDRNNTPVYKIIERANCVYIPAETLEGARIECEKAGVLPVSLSKAKK